MIGVTGSRRGGRTQVWATCHAVRRAGGRARRLRPGDAFDRLDALVITGGADIDAARYREGDASAVRRPDPARDAYELKLIAHADEGGLPLLGICRGAQLVNVARGGTLYPEITESHGPLAARRSLFARKRVQVDPESRLGRVLGRDSLRVNALHHQSVRELGAGLAVSGWDELGLVQAIEASGPRWVLGVQWHPELLPLHESARRIFAALVQAARV